MFGIVIETSHFAYTTNHKTSLVTFWHYFCYTSLYDVVFLFS